MLGPQEGIAPGSLDSASAVLKYVGIAHWLQEKGGVLLSGDFRSPLHFLNKRKIGQKWEEFDLDSVIKFFKDNRVPLARHLRNAGI